MYEKLKEINQTWRTFFTRFYMTDFSTFIMWSIFHSTFFLHISHVEKFLHMTDFLHLSHVEKFPLDRFASTFLMWRNFSTWQIFSTFLMWRISPRDRFSPPFSCGEICPRDRFSPPFSCGEISTWQICLHISHVEKFLHVTDFPHISHVEKFLHVTEFPHIYHLENFPTWHVMGRISPHDQFFLHRRRLWRLWQISGMLFPLFIKE